jgi:hypothetical protein
MADVQKQLIAFHDKIRLGTYDENATLREKRDRVLRRLAAGLEAQRRTGREIPAYESFGQGSYAMNTGIKPITGDFDIDVGIIFDLASTEQPDPTTVKRWVHDALEKQTAKVLIRRSCVTVFYQEDGEDVYHVDLAIYSSPQRNADRRPYLAKGKEHSAPEHRYWELSQPTELLELLDGRHNGEDAKQFRRVIRFMKRWAAASFAAGGNSRPSGIALTIAAFHWMTAATAPAADDLAALRSVVDSMAMRFAPQWDPDEQRSVPRLAIPMPAAPGGDLLQKMTAQQMTEFKEKLEAFAASARAAQQDVDAHTACKELQRHFGNDFPVPAKEDTARPQGRPFSHSGNSG